MVNSLPVVLASDQSAIPVSVNDFPAVVSVKASAASGLTINGDVNVTEVGGSSVTLGQKTSALSVPVVLPSDQTINVGSITVGTIDVVIPAIVVTGSINSITNSVQIELTGRSGLGVLLAGTWDASVSAELSSDNATTWQDTTLVSTIPGGPVVLASSTQGNGLYRIGNLDGITHARIRPQIYSSGTVEVTLTATQAASPVAQTLVALDQTSPSVAGFSRLRVASPFALFDSQHVLDSQPFSWETNTALGGVATFLPNEASMSLTVGPSSGSLCQRRSRERFRYQAARSHQVISTGVLGSSTLNVVQKIGYYDNLNGVYFQQSEFGLAVVLRSSTSGSPIETLVNQSDWNVDSFDGTGPSGIQLDPTKANIFYIEFEWLGAGVVRMGFSVNGVIYICHRFLNTNDIDSVYMGSGSLPCTYEIFTIGPIVGTVLMKQICTSVLSEGGQPLVPFRATAGTGTTPVVVGTGQHPIIIIRPSLLFNGITNRAHVYPYAIDIVPLGNQPIQVQAVFNPTIIGTPTWVSTSSFSGIEYTTTSGLTISGGVPVVSIFANSGEVRHQALDNTTPHALVLDSTGTIQTTLAIVGTSLEGETPVCGSINWKEIH